MRPAAVALLIPLAGLLPAIRHTGPSGAPRSTAGCGGDTTRAAAEVRAINERVRAAHFTRDVGAFLAAWADTVVDVRGGAVRSVARETLRAPLGEYWRALTFDDVTDATAPVVRVSPDGCMAWLVGHVRIQAREATAGGERPLRLEAAWLSVFERAPGAPWRLVATANSDVTR